ncbi:MAG: ribonuclease Z [Myxococcales bacterium]|nr:ribonuclease Z [Myxococcales bacterium]
MAKTSFLPRLVNGQTGDPALFVDLLREKRALLFDCGNLTPLSPSEILRISDVFVSHAHIDHFIGFDHLLRLHLGRGKRVRVFGPPGITGCVRGKLSGYTWNLVRHQRLVYEVHEWSPNGIRVTEFVCRRRFAAGAARDRKNGEYLWQDDHIRVRTAPLDHRIPSLAFAVSERDFLNVDPVKVSELSLTPGAWLNDLKRRVRAGDPTPLLIDGRQFEVADLARRLLHTTPGRTIAYAADALGNEANLAAIAELARGADWLFCEGAFLEEDRERANETYHLTAAQAGRAARLAGARRLMVFHFSPKYEGRFSQLEEEAAREHGRMASADEDDEREGPRSGEAHSPARENSSGNS